MPAAAWAVPAAIGAIGLVQQGHAQHDANANVQKGLAAQKPVMQAQKDLLGLAEGYNPHQEDAAAIGGANASAAALLHQQLSGLQGNFAAGGGQPTGDTAFNIGATNVANRVLDPLKQFQAQLAATETSRKMAAFQPVLGAPAGGVSNAYFNAASFMQPNYGPSLQMFTDALKKLNIGGGAVGPGGAGVGYGGITPPKTGTLWSGDVDPNTGMTGGNSGQWT